MEGLLFVSEFAPPSNQFEVVWGHTVLQTLRQVTLLNP